MNRVGLADRHVVRFDAFPDREFAGQDQIIGDLLVRGRSASLSAPLLAAAFTHLSVYQNRLSAP